jgi:hypothetical protein
MAKSAKRKPARPAPEPHEAPSIHNTFAVALFEGASFHGIGATLLPKDRAEQEAEVYNGLSRGLGARWAAVVPTALILNVHQRDLEAKRLARRMAEVEGGAA